MRGQPSNIGTHKFFTEFFQGGPENTIGKILLRSRRRYLNNLSNPLGLAYSLYRGGDVYLEAPLSALPRVRPVPSQFQP